MLDELINASFSKELITVILAMLPVAELRLAIPVSLNIFHLPWYQVFYLSIIGNLIPVPFLLLFFDAVSKLLKKTPAGAKFIDWLMRRTARRTVIVEKYKMAGLVIFVAIPLPLTGAWTGSLIAYILGLRFWPSFLAITGGVLAAAVIVTVLTLMGWIGAGIAIAAFIVLAAVGAWKL
ncbi:MAG: small multi-drug export protein [Dehalococcoidales bacterium]|nr:small multi-drug export protein [Dehalococcoidales bacterium]